MLIDTSQLDKLRRIGAEELIGRGKQELTKLAERWLGAGVGEMSDASLLRAVSPARPAQVAERIKHRSASAESKPLIFPTIDARADFVAIINARFHTHTQEIIARADEAREGRFDLLGLHRASFGEPIDWRLEPLSGKRTAPTLWSRVPYLDPQTAGDKKVTWELNRHQHFVTFGQAYWLTGEHRYVQAFVSQATAWMDANPPKIGINWASSLELAFRSISWLWAWHLMADAPEMTDSFIARLLKHLIAHGRHIEAHLSTYFSPNTHLTGEALGLYFLGTALPELKPAARWRNRGRQILLDELSRQVRDDGVYFEQTSYYHRYTADFYAHFLLLARATGDELPDDVPQRLSLLMEHLAWLTRPDGTTPLIGDDDGGRLLCFGRREADDFRDTLAVGASLFARGDWKFVAGAAPAELLWLLGAAGLERYDELRAVAPDRHAKSFEAGGYYVLRDGWKADSSAVVIDCGPHGSLSCGHAHADSLSFDFASGGVNWLVDPGTFTYTGDATERDAFRSTAAHNAVSVDGVSQSVPAGPFSWKTRAESRRIAFVDTPLFGYFAGEHRGYERLADPVRHTRQILLVKPSATGDVPAYLVVRDQLSAQSTHEYKLHYHFPAACRAEAERGEVIARTPAGSRLKLAVFGTAEVSAEVCEGFVSHCYAAREPALIASFKAVADGPQEFVSVLLPASPRQLLPVVSTLRAGAYLIESACGTDLLLTHPGALEQSVGKLDAHSALAWARFTPTASCGGAISGRRLAVGAVSLEAAQEFDSCAISIRPDAVEIWITDTEEFTLDGLLSHQQLRINGRPRQPARRYTVG